MSGGSLDYVYMKLDDAITEVKHRSTTPLHTAFWKHLEKVSKALYDFEWMASGDTSEGDEEESIRAVLTPVGELDSAREEAQKALKNLEEVLNRVKPDRNNS